MIVAGVGAACLIEWAHPLGKGEVLWYALQYWGA